MTNDGLINNMADLAIKMISKSAQMSDFRENLPNFKPTKNYFKLFQ